MDCDAGEAAGAAVWAARLVDFLGITDFARKRGHVTGADFEVNGGVRSGSLSAVRPVALMNS